MTSAYYSAAASYFASPAGTSVFVSTFSSTFGCGGSVGASCIGAVSFAAAASSFGASSTFASSFAGAASSCFAFSWAGAVCYWAGGCYWFMKAGMVVSAWFFFGLFYA